MLGKRIGQPTNRGLLDATYLRLDASNDPVTGDTTFNQGIVVTGGIGLGSGGFIDTTKILNIDHTVVPASDTYGFFTQLRENSSTTSPNFHFGGFIGAQILSGNTANYSGGIRGASFIAEHAGGGSVNQAFVFEAVVNNTSTGRIQSGMGLNVAAPTNTGGGTIASFTGVYVQRPTVAGTNNALITEGGNVVFNDFVTDSDFTIRSDNYFSFFVVDASADTFFLDGGAIGYFSSSAIVFNDFSEDRDFTVRGDTVFELLKTDAGAGILYSGGSINVVGGYNINGTAGATGTFTTGGGGTVTVTAGLVTSIV